MGAWDLVRRACVGWSVWFEGLLHLPGAEVLFDASFFAYAEVRFWGSYGSLTFVLSLSHGLVARRFSLADFGRDSDEFAESLEAGAAPPRKGPIHPETWVASRVKQGSLRNFGKFALGNGEWL